MFYQPSRAIVFQSTLPVWGATREVTVKGLLRSISIHAPRVGSDGRKRTEKAKLKISIHAPRVGSDRQDTGGTSETKNFNPRSPCGERLFAQKLSTASDIFQSTLPVWGATTVHTLQRNAYDNFNPRSPCGERRTGRTFPFPSRRFQSTLPVWGATVNCDGVDKQVYISIHAPRVGSDVWLWPGPLHRWHFNPRSPCGERQTEHDRQKRNKTFQSTLPVWGATSAQPCPTAQK